MRDATKTKIAKYVIIAFAVLGALVTLFASYAGVYVGAVGENPLMGHELIIFSVFDYLVPLGISFLLFKTNAKRAIFFSIVAAIYPASATYIPFMNGNPIGYLFLLIGALLLIYFITLIFRLFRNQNSKYNQSKHEI